MPAEPVSFDSSILEQLACPACLEELRLENPDLNAAATQAAQNAPCLACLHCGLQYPVVDGIPVLIAKKAMAKA